MTSASDSEDAASEDEEEADAVSAEEVPCEDEDTPDEAESEEDPCEEEETSDEDVSGGGGAVCVAAPMFLSFDNPEVFEGSVLLFAEFTVPGVFSVPPFEQDVMLTTMRTDNIPIAMIFKN